MLRHKHLQMLSLTSFHLNNIYMNKFSLTVTLIMVVTGNVIHNVFSKISDIFGHMFIRGHTLYLIK
jgi:hypothetical protein